MMTFDMNENLIMAMFQKESRLQTMNEIRGVIPFVKDDEELLPLINSTLEKMSEISDQDFLALDLEPYKQEPVEG